MNQKVSLQQMIPLLFGLMLAGAIMLLVLNFGSPPAVRLAPDLAGDQTAATVTEDFDYEQAADISAMRWQAMARFYEAQWLLTRDDFDYEQAAEYMAFRWQAMAKFYEKQGLLTRDDFDYEQAAENMAFRWLEMAKAYERMGLLNDN